MDWIGAVSPRPHDTPPVARVAMQSLQCISAQCGSTAGGERVGTFADRLPRPIIGKVVRVLALQRYRAGGRPLPTGARAMTCLRDELGLTTWGATRS